MKERLAVRKKLPVAVPMAARAVAICEGCPMAKFCAVKDANLCPSPEAAVGGEYATASLDLPKLSYRKELMDDDVPFVAAKLQPASLPKPMPKQAPRLQAAPSLSMPPVAKPKQVPMPRVVKKPIEVPRRPDGETVGDILADIMISTFSARSIGVLRKSRLQ